MPGTELISSIVAFFSWRAEPKTRRRARLRAGPMPGMSSKTDLRLRLRAQLAVVGDGETVRLVAQPLHQVERL